MKHSHGYTLDHFCVAGSSDEEDEISEDLVATTVSTTRDRKKPRRYAEVEDAPASRWTEHNIAAPEPEQEDDESSEAESEDAESVHSDCVSVEDDESEDDEAVMRAPRRVTPVPALPKDDGEPKMRKQKGFLYFSALNRGAAWAEVGAENPDMSAEEKTRVVMKKLGEMWAELDDAAKQKWKDDAPMVAVKPKKAKKKGGSAAMDAAAAAQRKGLPAGWTASKKIGARWTYVAPDGEKFTSLASAETAAAKKNPSHDAKPVPKATGHWTAAEHDEFLKCLDIYGREWKKVAERITTRTAAQIRSHAQKYFKKIEAAGEEDKPDEAATPPRVASPPRVTPPPRVAPPPRVVQPSVAPAPDAQRVRAEPAPDAFGLRYCPERQALVRAPPERLVFAPLSLRERLRRNAATLRLTTRAEGVEHVLLGIEPAMRAAEDVALKDPGVPARFWIIKGNIHLKEHLARVRAESVDRAYANLGSVANVNLSNFDGDDFEAEGLAYLRAEIGDCVTLLEDAKFRAAVHAARDIYHGRPINGIKMGLSMVLAHASMSGVFVDAAVTFDEDEHGNALLPFPLLERIVLAFYGSPDDFCSKDALMGKQGAECVAHAAALIDMDIHVKQRLASLLVGVLRAERARAFAALTPLERDDVVAVAAASERARLSAARCVTARDEALRIRKFVFYAGDALLDGGTRVRRYRSWRTFMTELEANCWTKSAIETHEQDSSDTVPLLFTDQSTAAISLPDAPESLSYARRDGSIVNRWTPAEIARYMDGFIAMGGDRDCECGNIAKDYVRTRSDLQVREFGHRYLEPLEIASAPEIYVWDGRSLCNILSVTGAERTQLVEMKLRANERSLAIDHMRWRPPTATEPPVPPRLVLRAEGALEAPAATDDELRGLGYEIVTGDDGTTYYLDHGKNVAHRTRPTVPAAPLSGAFGAAPTARVSVNGDDEEEAESEDDDDFFIGGSDDDEADVSASPRPAPKRKAEAALAGAPKKTKLDEPAAA